MAIFFFTFGFFLLLMALMAVGVIFSNKELKGSCGGPGKCECLLAGTKACPRKNPSPSEPPAAPK